jgi:glutamate/tyrosine decarboxylase-like PLP-dependent enzyme
MPEKLALPPEDFRRLAEIGAGFVAEYYGSLANRPVFVPSTAEAIRKLVEEPLPQSGAAFPELLGIIRDVVSRYNRHSAHPRCFGYICSPGAPITAVSHMIAAALNINVTCWRSSPSGTEIEHVVINWLKEMLDYPADAAGLLVSGGSMANFAALAAARSAKAPGNVVRDGMSAARARMCAYVSEEGHFSITKAAGMLGIGESSVRQIKTDSQLRIDLADLESHVQQDRAAGHLPFCVVANAGTTATGAFDPLGDLADFARRHNLWLHVDAAYGGFAALAPAAHHLFARIAEADSVALDPHKWLYGPMGCGCVLYKDPETARAAFSHDAEYTRRIGLVRDEAFAFWDYGPELSRQFRALDLWLLIKYVGAAALAEAVESNIACAKHLEKLVEASDDFEMLAPVELSIFCFRYRPRGFAGDLEALNEETLVRLQRDGSSYVSNARIRGEFALRGCVLNYRTTMDDMQTLLDDVRRVCPA